MGNLAANIAATGMMSNDTLLKTISGNLANMNTTGYKSSDASFLDLLYINFRTAGSQSSSSGTTFPVSSQIGLGSQLGAISKNFTQGAVSPTPGKPLNMAIQGVGFFQVTMPDGTTAYTRDGTLVASSTGEIQTVFGYNLSPSITIPSGTSDITISQSGEISGTVNGTITSIGTLQLASFPNPAGLKAIGDNLYLENPESSGTATVGNPQSQGFGNILQYYLEGSNVNSIVEITKMIEAQRGYEFCAKMVQGANDTAKIDIQTLSA